MLAQRGIEVSREAVRFWVIKFGPLIAANPHVGLVRRNAPRGSRRDKGVQCPVVPIDNPFRWFDSSPEVIQMVVMLYVRFPLSLRNVEDLAFEHGVDICHETVRL